MDEDIKRLDYLLTLALPEVHVEGSPVAIRYADIPEDLRAAFERFHVGRGRPIVNGETLIWRPDWEQFLYLETARHHSGMHRGALLGGATGPGAEDMTSAAILSDWVLVRDPEENGAFLVGTSESHPKVQGRLIQSSRLCGLDPAGTWARTVSRWYRLKRMLTATEFLAFYGAGVAQYQVRMISMADAQEDIQRDLELFG